MKKVLLFCFIPIFILSGCFHSKNQNYTDILNAELNDDVKKNEMPFSVSLTHIPVVKYKIDGKDIFMMVDTGAVTSTLLNTPAVRKIVPKDLFAASKKITLKSSYSLWYNCPDGSFLLDPKGIFTTGKLKYPADGFLGLPFLEQYKNVVFDYKTNRIYFNREPVCGNSISMRKVGLYWFTTIECNGVKTNAVIDTGCFNVFINKPNAKAAVGQDEIVNIKIGHIECNGISLKPNSTIITNKIAENGLFKNENVIGYPCFKDHIIQLDFENGVFRME